MATPGRQTSPAQVRARNRVRGGVSKVDRPGTAETPTRPATTNGRCRPAGRTASPKTKARALAKLEVALPRHRKEIDRCLARRAETIPTLVLHRTAVPRGTAPRRSGP